ncbi:MULTISPECIES: ATP phosphoribosyltransferase regulatory subunit [unclassified Paenibacillus]|uniref:ATP phosphoribosyltransferase regulatory subunit n=1 Tax=unclassified Paenibacillus TaxID=185978 RepID=UPI00095734F8|nr:MULTISPECIES: ATP phosphoribosyltransferase regulatory subunit [unclassified Paenibacillus]ASS67857.1 ATP phosphoribosyltransferase regulatory subunit [Paenibacillus sp. RUD330]SIR45823.1 ATP phosphoribosyltransferase regulatory subunit [Paenibacillus sp. RU4X]SIR55272.1 ATP phosphoribosyltransferase regulatory subunit [Paenibacillus sp. RU4T]
MSKPKVFEKPVGVKDYLPHAVSKLRQIESSVLSCMERWGYDQIMTPTLEYYDTVGVASSTSDQRLFKLLNNRGTTLVLRSDMTAPIARVVSSLLRDQPFPLRLSYHSSVFRAFENEAGRDAEFFQTGVELVGDASAEADAEVIALAIASLQAAGVEKFRIAVGHVGFLNGLLEELLPGRTECQGKLKDYLLNRDHVGYRDQLGRLGLTEQVQQELKGLLRLRGGQEICTQAMSLTPNATAQESIRHLCEIWDVLEAYGVSEHVLIDLTMIGDFSYYTGMTFEGYAADLGFPVVGGGRYDNLLQQFGRPAPATGFAVKTTRVLELVGEEQEAPRRILIGYDGKGRERALAEAIRLRGQGAAVVTACMEAPGIRHGEAQGSEEPERNALRLADGESVKYGGLVYGTFLPFFDGNQEEGDGR